MPTKYAQVFTQFRLQQVSQSAALRRKQQVTDIELNSELRLSSNQH